MHKVFTSKPSNQVGTFLLTKFMLETILTKKLYPDVHNFSALSRSWVPSDKK